MSQFFFNPLVFQAACNRYRDRLKEMDPILFPDGQKSLLDEDMSPEEADKATEDALEIRLHQGSVSGNLVFFAKTFSDGKVSPDLAESVRNIILSIDGERPLLERGIRSHFENKTLPAFLMGIGVGMGVGAFVTAQFFLKHPKTVMKVTPVSAKVLSAISKAANLSTAASAVLLVRDDASVASGGASNSTEIWPVVLALAVVAAVVGIAYYWWRTKKKPASPAQDEICNQKQAYEVLKLVECLADIYRNKR